MLFICDLHGRQDIVSTSVRFKQALEAGRPIPADWVCLVIVQIFEIRTSSASSRESGKHLFEIVDNVGWREARPSQAGRDRYSVGL